VKRAFSRTTVPRMEGWLAGPWTRR